MLGGVPVSGSPWHSPRGAGSKILEFSDEDMDMLRRANGCPGAEAPVNAPIVACHRDQPSTAHPLRWCAGFLAVVGEQHLGIRLALAFEALPPQAGNPPTPLRPVVAAVDVPAGAPVKLPIGQKSAESDFADGLNALQA